MIGSTNFVNGPAKGAKLNLRRVPTFLRVVVNDKGDVDALDMPEDTPTDKETVYAYRTIDGTMVSGIMCGSKKFGGCKSFNSATYSMCPVQPDMGILRNRKKWEKWVEETCSGGIKPGEKLKYIPQESNIHHRPYHRTVVG